jgi:hypothetical protein
MAGEDGAGLHFIWADKPERTERKVNVQCSFLERCQPAGQHDRRLHKKRLPGKENHDQIQKPRIKVNYID